MRKFAMCFHMIAIPCAGGFSVHAAVLAAARGSFDSAFVGASIGAFCLCGAVAFAVKIIK
jgi:hypothetical protein